MGIWRRREASRQKPPSPNATDRKVIRFRRVVEQHGEVLDLFADLKDKQSGDYILDRQYIEARLDRAYEGVRRILYDMHVLSDSESGEGYDQLDSLRSISEKILREAPEGLAENQGEPGDEAPDWETMALQALFEDLTRAPSYGSGTRAGAGTEPAVPQSLVEWAGWAHMKAAEWITDNLRSVSASPTAHLCGEASAGLSIQAFVLGGASGAEKKVKQCLAGEPSGRIEDLPLVPLSYFFEGLFRASDGAGVRRPRLADRKKSASRVGGATPLHLYAGDGFLLLRFPSSLSVRLFGCSLSADERENLLYLFGCPLPSRLEGLPSGPFCSETEPFPAHGCGIAGRWMYWATGFSWAQGEERVRMLGHMLSPCMPLPGGGTETPESVSPCLQEGILRFLKEVVFGERASAFS